MNSPDLRRALCLLKYGEHVFPADVGTRVAVHDTDCCLHCSCHIRRVWETGDTGTQQVFTCEPYRYENSSVLFGKRP